MLSQINYQQVINLYIYVSNYLCIYVSNYLYTYLSIYLGIRSLNSSINGSILLYTTSPQLCCVSLGIVPLVGIGAMYMAKYSRKVTEKLRSNESETISFALERCLYLSNSQYLYISNYLYLILYLICFTV
jgi:hypothetical protein